MEIKNYSNINKSTTIYDRLLKEIKTSNIFEIRIGRPIQFRIKPNNK